MPEKRWKLLVCPVCGQSEGLDVYDEVLMCCHASEPVVMQAVEVIEAAPVEAELERLRKIEAAARDALTGLEVAADMRCTCDGYYKCNSCPNEIAEQAQETADALREALER